MTNKKWNALCLELVDVVKSFSPVKTGNLKFNAVNYMHVDNDTFVIKVNLEKADYMPYTNEPWIHPRWNGKKNPNEGWCQTAKEGVIKKIIEELDGEIK